MAKANYLFQGCHIFSRHCKKELGPVKIIKAIKSAGISKAFEGFFIHGSLVYALNHIKNGSEKAVLFPFFNDVFDGRFANAFHSAETKSYFAFFVYRKSFLRFV